MKHATKEEGTHTQCHDSTDGGQERLTGNLRTVGVNSRLRGSISQVRRSRMGRPEAASVRKITMAVGVGHIKGCDHHANDGVQLKGFNQRGVAMIRPSFLKDHSGCTVENGLDGM